MKMHSTSAATSPDDKPHSVDDSCDEARPDPKGGGGDPKGGDGKDLSSSNDDQTPSRTAAKTAVHQQNNVDGWTSRSLRSSVVDSGGITASDKAAAERLLQRSKLTSNLFSSSMTCFQSPATPPSVQTIIADMKPSLNYPLSNHHHHYHHQQQHQQQLQQQLHHHHHHHQQPPNVSEWYFCHSGNSLGDAGTTSFLGSKLTNNWTSLQAPY